MSFKKDYTFGLQKEQEVLPKIKNYFQREIEKTINGYERYDFYDEKYKYELKSRNVKYETYPTTLIPKDKIRKRIIFLFNFTDGLYYIKYKPKIFQLFECKEFVRNARSDFNDKQKEYVYIPIEYLKKII
jgi:hypothetical protein